MNSFEQQYTFLTLRMDVLLAELKALHHQEAENRDIKHSLKELLKIMTKVETILAKTSTDVDTLIAVASGTTAISAPADVIAAQALSDKVAAAIGNTPVIVLTAKSSALPLTGPSPLSVQFSSKGSANPDGSALAFSWTFGDNSAVDTTPSPIHVYSAPGTYSATLVVTNLAGQQATATVITIVAS